MSSVATNAADDVGGEVLLFRAVILAVAYLAAVLASLVFVVTQSAVEGSQLTQLAPFQLILSLGDGCCCLNYVVDQLLGLVDLLFCVSHDETMQVFFLVAGGSSIRTALALLDRALATDGNFCTGF